MQDFKVQVINRHRLNRDGKGVTTLVGLLGCPLRCKYCINKDVLSLDKYTTYTPEKLVEQIMIDYCYFVATGGGVTFGGGESLLYAEAILEFKKLLPEFVELNVETCLNVKLSDDILSALADNVNHFIIDIKAVDEVLYESYTGVRPTYLWNNLKAFAKLNIQDKCRIRIPVIPEYKDKLKVNEEEKEIRQLGFKNIDIFPYILREYMK